MCLIHASSTGPRGRARAARVADMLSEIEIGRAEGHICCVMTQASLSSARRGADWLATAGLRPTRQRLALAALLVGDGQDRHVTAESLFEAAAVGIITPAAPAALFDFLDVSRWCPITSKESTF